MGLHEFGHEVTVLTGFPSYPYDRLYPGYRLRLYQREQYGGVNVIRVPFYADYRRSRIRRALNYMTFAALGSILGPILVDKPDAILVFQMSPITMAIPAAMIRATRGGRLYLWVQDLWPETLEGLGIVRNPLLLRTLGALMRFIGRHCEKVLVQSKGFIAPVAARGIPRDRIEYLPNWAEDIYQVTAPDEAFLQSEGLSGGFNVVFAGNIGVAQNLHVLLDAAAALRHHPEIRFVVIGDGSDYRAVVDRARARTLTNVVFKGRQPLEKMPKYLAAGDALLVHLKMNPVFAMTVPSKLQSYMACGRPVLAALSGSGADIVARAGAGVVCRPDSPEELRNAVLALWKMPREEREQLGRNARKYYEEHFDRRLILLRLQSILGGTS